MRIHPSAILLCLAVATACTEPVGPDRDGALGFSASTVGEYLDADGYLLVVDSVPGSARRIPANGSFVLTGLAPGSHSLSVSDVAENCATSVPDPWVVTVASQDTLELRVDVVCVAPPALARLETTTTGSHPDPEFLIAIDGAAPAPLVARTSMLLALSQGEHSFLLSGVAENCEVTGPNPRIVTLVPRLTTDVSFAVTCAFEATLVVTAVTTGEDRPVSFLLAIDGSTPVTLDANGSVSRVVNPGAHTLELTAIAPNCVAQQAYPLPVVTGFGGTVNITLTVTCLANPSVRVTTTTTGWGAPSSFIVGIGMSDCDYYQYYYCWFDASQRVPANGTTVVTFRPGAYRVTLADIPFHCSVAGSNPRPVTLVAGTVTDVSFEVTCVEPAIVTVASPTSGLDPDDGFVARIEDTNGNLVRYFAFPSNLTAQFTLLPGTYVVRLSEIASNCTAASANPVTITVTAGSTTNVSVPVTCLAFPVLRVTATSSGTQHPATYFVGVDFGCYDDEYYGYTYCNYAFSLHVPATGTASVKLPAGPHTVTLTNLPSNCRVTSANDVQVNLAPATTTDLAFAVSCQ